MADTVTMAAIWQHGPDGIVAAGDAVRIDGGRLRQVLAVPTVACVEKGQDISLPLLERGVLVRLSTNSAFADGDLGEALVDAVIARGWLDPARRDDVVLVLHEALANAVIHGNLGVMGGNATSPEEFRLQGELIARRLGDPAYGRLPITVMALLGQTDLEITVQDCGEGFVREEDGQPWRIPPEAKCGRGLGLMQASSDDLRYEDRGRRLVVTYGKAAG